MKTLTFKATGRTGKQWVAYLKSNKFNVSDCAESVLLNPEFDRLNQKKGTEYRVVVVPHKEIFDSGTTEDIRKWGAKKGYTSPSPEVACLIREALSNEEIEALGVWYVVTQHDPIADRGGSPDVLDADRFDGGRWLGADWAYPRSTWGAGGASVLLVPASTSFSDTLYSGDLELRLSRVEANAEGVSHFPNLYSDELVESLSDAWNTSIQRLAKGRYDFCFDYEDAFRRADFLCPERVMDVVERELGTDYQTYAGALTSEPGSEDGEWHTDAYTLFDQETDATLPPFYLTLLIALDDVGEEDGPTEMEVGGEKRLALMKAGDAVLFDGRVRHRGLANRSGKERRMLYVVFCKPWYNDYV